jgi:tripartite-type tricarboxylate transporter receptor subunit TctC
MVAVAALACAMLLGLSPIALAETYPNRTITLVAPFAAGGSSDLLARVTAQGMSQRLGQTVIVENRDGAGGTLGTGVVAHSSPDGYTLVLAGVGPLVFGVGIYGSHLPYDVHKDLAPIGLVGTTPTIIVAGRATTAKSLADLVAMAKAHPGTVTYGSAGVGGALHLAAELLQHMAGIKLVHVPYRGGAPALTDVLGGQVQFGFLDAGSILGQRSNPDLRIIAVAGKERMPLWPDAPTAVEQGYPGLVVPVWYGVLAPKKTPPEVIDILEKATQDTANDPAFQKLLIQSGFVPSPGDRNAFAALIDSELARWLPIMKDANITPPR